jgi:NAD(P)H-flavin reductase
VSALPARIARITEATPRSRLLSIDLEGRPFVFSAGQAVLIGPRGAVDPKPYSIATSRARVAAGGPLEVLVAVDSSGEDFGWMRPGAAIDVDGPFGTFTLPPDISQRRLLFVAGGTGIAPIRAMLEDILARVPRPQISLLYSARRADEFAFIAELEAHAHAARLELHQTVTREDLSWQGRRGRVGRAEFEAVMHEPADTLCFVCGPPAMVEESIATLSALGVPTPSIRTEQWGK